MQEHYIDPSIIILDEATNALDQKTENEILKSILKFKKDITIVMISHRLELIKKFDKVLFLDQGKLEDLIIIRISSKQT